jgi:aldose 1-epimerase
MAAYLFPLPEPGGGPLSRYAARILIKEGFQIIELTDAVGNSIAEIIPEIGNNLYRFEVMGKQVIMPPVNLASFKHEAFGSYRYGTPVLFPPNRVKNGSFMFKGRRYSLSVNEAPHHLHGSIGYETWEVVDLGSSEDQGAFVTSRLRYATHPEILEYFPHPLTFTLTFKLKEGRLQTEGTIVNDGADEAPFAFGMHPYFSLPYESGESMELTVPAAEEWPVTREAFVTGTPSVTELIQKLNEGVNLRDFNPLDCSLISLGQGDRTCRIAMKDSGYTIAYRFDEQFPFVVLFRPDWSSSYSLEPYTYVTDAFNLPYESELTGARGIQAGEQVRFRTSMWIETEGGNLNV